MNLDMSTATAEGYTSGCQITRRISEDWAAANLFCAACESDRVTPAPANTKAVDFYCPSCSVGYQLKAGRQWNERRVPDGSHSALTAAVCSDKVPNLLVLQYSPDWQVKNLVLIPSFVFNVSAIEKRKPLSPTARRAGWVGCNILLSALPDLGKLRIVESGSVVSPLVVRGQYQRLRPLANVAPKVRGWALDVLRIVQSFERREFLLGHVYAKEIALSTLHPGNSNVRAKIRQQLQVLRDMGIIKFHGGGRYELSI